MLDEDKAPEEEEEDDLTPDEKEEKQYTELVGISDKIMDRWRAATPEADQQALVDRFAETGNLDHAMAGVDEIETAVVQSAFMLHAERNVYKPLGLTAAQYNSYLDPADAVTLRRAVVSGDWGMLYSHAQAVAAHIAEHGDSNAGNY